MGKLQKEIKQTKPFRSRRQEAVLAILRTADILKRRWRVAEEFGVTGQQYNVLRILRGAGAAGATCKDIGSRMIARDPDITRLMDRLERRRLITRGRAREDRRFVATRLTKAGLELVNSLDRPIEQTHQELMKQMTAKKLGQLVRLLETLRSGF